MLKKFSAVALAASLTGCANLMAKKVPQYDMNASPKSQAMTFVNAKGQNLLAGSTKVFLSECNVAFGHQTGASAGTSSGFYSGDQRGRTDERVTSIYYLKGLDDSQMQSLADQVCAEAEAKLTASGFEVIPASSLAGNESFVKMSENGKKSPFDYKIPGNQLYKIYARTGSTVFNPQYLGAAGIGMAFKAMGGDQPPQREAMLVNELGAHAVRVNAILDFAALQGEKTSLWIKKDTAEVKEKVAFAMKGSMLILPKDQVRCDKAFGNKVICNPKGKYATFGLKHPLTASDKFWVSVKDATTTGDKLAAGIGKGLAILTAMAGGHGSSASVSRTDVVVDPTSYNAVAKKAASHFFEMMTYTAKGS